MSNHAHEKFFCEVVSASGLSSADQDELTVFFDMLEPEQADFFYVLLSEESHWLPKILANYRAKCAAFQTRDDAAWAEILKTEVVDNEQA
jgi:hypothetical protein